MKVVVTGAAGFIGSHLADALVADGADVVGIDSLDPGVWRRAPDYLNPAVDYYFTDLRWWRPGDDLDDVEAVVHCAALGGVGRAGREPANVLEANVGGTARLLDATVKWPRLQVVVLLSSFSVYGTGYVFRCRRCGAERNGDRSAQDLEQAQYEVLCARCQGPTDVLPLGEEASPAPLEVYGASKLMQELCFRGFDRCPVHFLRQSSVYGPRLRLDDGEATIIAKLAGWLSTGRRPTLYEDGRQIRDWVHVGDVVAAVRALVLGRGAPSVVNVCTGRPTTLIEACRVLADVMGIDTQPEVVGGYRPGDMRHCLGDPARLTALIGREPTSFFAGARQTFGRPVPSVAM